MYMEVKKRVVTVKKQPRSGLTKGDWAKLDKKFDHIDQRFNQHEKLHDRIILKLVDHEQRIDVCVTKQEFHEKMDEMNGRFDDMFGVLKDIRQEQAAFVLASRRHEEKIEVHDVDIKKIKQHIRIS